LEHAAHPLDDWLSRRHWKVRAVCAVWLSTPPNVMCADVLGVVAGGPLLMDVSGAATSTIVQAELAGVASVLPAWSVARTANVWLPTLRSVSVTGEAHVANAPPSVEHSNVEPVSLAEKVSVALVLAVEAFGPESIVVSGAVRSAMTH
jgi:hypothetical protein